MRAAPLLAALLLAAAPAGAVTFDQVFVPQGRIPLAAIGPVTAVAVTDASIFVAEMDGARVCEYTHAGNAKRCLDELPSGRGPLGVQALAFLPPVPAYRAGALYVSATGHGRIYRVDLHNQRVDRHADLRTRSIAVASYGVLVGLPLQPQGRVAAHNFHRLTTDLRPQWSWEEVTDKVLAESPWSPITLGPNGEIYAAIGGTYSVGRYTPRGRLLYSFGEAGPVYENVVSRDTLSEDEWLHLWSPIMRLDVMGEWLAVTSRVTRGGRTWDLLDVYGLDGRPAVRHVALEGEAPMASHGGVLYTTRRDEPQANLYLWRLEVPDDLPEGGLVAALPPALSPVRAAAGSIGEMTWETVLPYLEGVYYVEEVVRSRPQIRFDPASLATRVPGYIEDIGQSVTQAVSLMQSTKVGKKLDRGFRRATLFESAGPAEATAIGWSQILDEPALRSELRGALCRELRSRGYPCP